MRAAAPDAGLDNPFRRDFSAVAVRPPAFAAAPAPAGFKTVRALLAEKPWVVGLDDRARSAGLALYRWPMGPRYRANRFAWKCGLSTVEVKRYAFTVEGWLWVRAWVGRCPRCGYVLVFDGP